VVRAAREATHGTVLVLMPMCSTTMTAVGDGSPPWTRTVRERRSVLGSCGRPSLSREASADRPLPQRGDLLDPLSLGGVVTDSRAAIDYYITEAHAYLPRGFTLANKTYYNQRTGKYTEIDYGLEYRAQCWSLTLTYTDFPEKSNELSFLLTLIGATSVDSKAASTLFEKLCP
jgi:hypothetical protein